VGSLLAPAAPLFCIFKVLGPMPAEVWGAGPVSRDPDGKIAAPPYNPSRAQEPDLPMQRLLSPLLLLIAACASAPQAAQVGTWGEMRRVLREGQTEARVDLAAVAKPGTWGVGVMADLEGEITVVDGEVHLAIVEHGAMTVRTLQDGDQATLLVLSEVEAWRAVDMPPIQSLQELELELGQALASHGLDPSAGPVPIRIEGAFAEVGLHVLDHSCPTADPDGPLAVRWSGPGRGSIVGIYAVGFAGKLTHHGQAMHLHVAVENGTGQMVSGHLEEVAFGAGVSVFLPAGD
jgi:alpha-acetolactate decarboxylase